MKRRLTPQEEAYPQHEANNTKRGRRVYFLTADASAVREIDTEYVKKLARDPNRRGEPASIPPAAAASTRMNREQVGAALRARREALDLKLEHVAEKLGVEVSTVARWERAQNGKPPSRPASSGVVAKLAELYGESLDDLRRLLTGWHTCYDPFHGLKP